MITVTALESWHKSYVALTTPSGESIYVSIVDLPALIDSLRQVEQDYRVAQEA